MIRSSDLPDVANCNAAADPQSAQQQLQELAVCVDEITSQTAITTLATILEVAIQEDGSRDTARAVSVAAEILEGTTALETHIRRLLAAATAI